MQAHFKEVQDKIDKRNEENVYKLKMKGVYDRVIAEMPKLTARGKLTGLQDDHLELNDAFYDGYMETDSMGDEKLLSWNFVGVERPTWLNTWVKHSPTVLVRVETYSRLTEEIQDKQFFVIDHKGNIGCWTQDPPFDDAHEYYEGRLHMPNDYKSFELVQEAVNTVLRPATQKVVGISEG